jgi:hypothetical protein
MSWRLIGGGWIGERGGAGSRRLTGGGSPPWRLDLACLPGNSSSSGEVGGWEWNPRHVLPCYLYNCVVCGLGHSPTTPTHILLFLLALTINSYTLVNLNIKES